MGYLFCALALMMGVTKGYCGKKTGGTVTTLPATMLFNAVRMLICIPIGLVFVLAYTKTLASLQIDGITWLISIVSGISTSIFVVTWIAAVRTGAYMMVDVFLTLGVAVPIVLCRVFFAEEIAWNHILGIALLAVAAGIMCTYNNKVSKARITPTSLLVLSVCGIANGMTSFSQKWYRYESCADVSVFNFYTYVFSAAVLLLCCTAVRFVKKEKEPTPAENRRAVLKKLAVYVTVMSLCLFLHSLFSTMAGKYLSASMIYPLMQGGSLVLSMLMSAIFFGERITPRCVVGILVTFGALLCINLL